MNESSLSKTTVAIIKTAGGHVSRVEAPDSAAGIPDLNFCIDGIEGDIELKYGSNKKWPVLRPSQVRWFRDRLRAGGRPFLLCLDGDNNKVYLIKGEEYIYLQGRQSLRVWENVSCRKWSMGDEFKQGLIDYIKGG